MLFLLYIYLKLELLNTWLKVSKHAKYAQILKSYVVCKKTKNEGKFWDSHTQSTAIVYDLDVKSNPWDRVREKYH
jgi:hypothetical protein